MLETLERRDAIVVPERTILLPPPELAGRVLPPNVLEQLLLARYLGDRQPLNAVTATVFTQHLVGQYGATAARRVDWVTDTIKVALLTAAASPNRDTWAFYSDLTNEVAAGSGYTTGGATLGTKSVGSDAGTHEARLLAANTLWTASTITARYAAVYKDTGSGATSPLLGYVDFGASMASVSGTFEIDWDATLGVIFVQAA